MLAKRKKDEQESSKATSQGKAKVTSTFPVVKPVSDLVPAAAFAKTDNPKKRGLAQKKKAKKKKALSPIREEVLNPIQEAEQELNKINESYRKIQEINRNKENAVRDESPDDVREQIDKLVR